jgi:hypothetical protein
VLNLKEIGDTKFFSCRIQHQGEENIRRHEEEGELVLVTESRAIDGGNRRGHIAIRVSGCSFNILQKNLII